MKKTLVFFCLFLSVLALHAKAVQEDYRNADDKTRVSYAMGMILGNNFLRSTGVDIDYDALKEGIRAAVEESITPQFSENEAIEIVETALWQAQIRISEENKLIEEEFLARNRERPEIFETASGLQYEIIEGTQGEKPKSDSVVRVNYVGTFLNGSPFDDSSMDEDGAYIPLDVVIPGWTEGLMLMSIGSTYRFFIPSNLAYGREGLQSVIPPYSTLIFLVDLLEILESDAFNYSPYFDDLEYFDDDYYYDYYYNYYYD